MCVCMCIIQLITSQNMDPMKSDIWTSLVAQLVKNPSANAGDMASTPDLGRSHIPWSN